MFRMGYMNPDNRNEGRKVSTIASWLARSCDFVVMLITIPIDRAPVRKIAAIPKRRATLPRSGTWKRNSPIPTARRTSSIPRTKYGRSLPNTSSRARMGVAMSCSIVPVSHSLATVREVRRAAITIMMTAIRPGTMEFFDSMSALNQTRERTSRGSRRVPIPPTLAS
jgi:hypothetical protein